MASKKVAHEPKKPPANEFFRGDERGFNGGEKSIISPVGSIFDCHTVSSNCMEKEIASQSPKSGKRVIR